MKMAEKKVDADAIKKEAKEIMDNFLKELKNIEVEKDYKNFRDENLRDEKEVNKDIKEDILEKKEFRKRFLKNAPKNSEDYIITKKGDWIK